MQEVEQIPVPSERSEVREDDVRREEHEARARRQVREASESNEKSILDWFNQAESSDDLAHGQMAIIWARWILVAAGLLLALWNPGDIADLRVQVLMILGLAGANFYLHSQMLMKRPAIAPVAYAASAADLAVITLIIMAVGGFTSELYVFYFPAILAFSVAFRTEVTGVYATAAVATYGLIWVATTDGAGAETAVTRMAMLVAVAFCGNVYWRIERDRRESAAGVRRERTVSLEPTSDDHIEVA